jgi:hypothetical protein
MVNQVVYANGLLYSPEQIYSIGESARDCGSRCPIARHAALRSAIALWT